MPNLNLASGSYSLATWTTGDNANPAAFETITIGTDVFEWNGVGANINVVIAGTLAGSIDNLIAAIEAVPVTGVEVWRDGNVLHLSPYDDDAEDYTMGGTLPTVAASQIADPWAFYTGKAGGGQVAYGSIAMTTALVARTFDVRVPFTPAGGLFQWLSATGVVLSTISATVTPLALGGGMRIDPTAGGVLPIAGDVLTWMMFE